MKVKELIKVLKQLDQEKNIWVLYDPPFACSEPDIQCLKDDDADWADMYEETEVGDYAIICY